MWQFAWDECKSTYNFAAWTTGHLGSTHDKSSNRNKNNPSKMVWRLVKQFSGSSIWTISSHCSHWKLDFWPQNLWCISPTSSISQPISCLKYTYWFLIKLMFSSKHAVLELNRQDAQEKKLRLYPRCEVNGSSSVQQQSGDVHITVVSSDVQGSETTLFATDR